ncbi:MAG: cytochrome c [Betaproteobacteria bacterium]|jgi:cytochrome c556|nr:cytochrome c [Betaproteobacteria bacterium]NBP44304.1 cytochrome c [Betaproteobacteria bacterium]
MTKTRLRHLALFTTLALATAATQAVTVAEKDAIKFRQSAFFLMGNLFGEINGMAQGRIPMNEATVKESAAVLNAVASLPFHGFPEGSDKGQTKAKPEIWSEADKFKKAASEAQSAIGKLNTAVAAGQFKDLKSLAADVGKSCKSCHDQFRQ